MTISIKKLNLDYAMIIAFIVIVLPQVILKPIGGDLSIVDIGAPMVIAYCIFRHRLKLPPPQKYLLIFIFYLLVSFLTMMLFGGIEYQESSPYLIRMVSLYAPVFLVPYLSDDETQFVKFGKVFVVISLIATVVIIALYISGWTGVSAHQTTESDDGLTVNRLGGLPGESGAFAYNILFVFYMSLIVYLVAERKWIKKIVMFGGTLIVLFLSFKYSLARVIVICAGAVILCGYFFTSISIVKKYFLFLFTFLVCSTSLFFVSPDSLDLSKYRLSNVASTDMNSVSSGRVSHWIDAVALYAESPFNVVFGVGHRMSVPFLGHAVENFFIQNLLDYGIVGTILFVIFLWFLLKPIIKNAKTKNGISVAILLVFTGIFLQWQFNDINTYYQTYPATLFFLSWWSQICRKRNAAVDNI
ncbi:TPA: hypothetical protein MBE92_002972 [Klebsiella pneumoniae]|nr:hypothetical protein [Klebsiella pneumoniae]